MTDVAPLLENRFATIKEKHMRICQCCGEPFDCECTSNRNVCENCGVLDLEDLERNEVPEEKEPE